MAKNPTVTASSRLSNTRGLNSYTDQIFQTYLDTQPRFLHINNTGVAPSQLPTLPKYVLITEDGKYITNELGDAYLM